MGLVRSEAEQSDSRLADQLHGVRQVHFKAGDERPLREPGIAVVQERVVVGVVAQAHALR